MRKILSGLLFRLLKGYEIWVLIALLLFAGLYIDYSFLNRYEYLSLIREGNCTVYDESYRKTIELTTPGSIKQYRFERQELNVADLYKYKTVALSEESSDKIAGNNYAYIELTVFSFMIVSSVSIPMVLMMLFVPVFFGRMFSDGTLKNYCACGYSRAKLYLSSVVFTFLLDLFLVLVDLLIFAFWCLYYEWKPPVYLPVAIALMLSSIFLFFTVTAICLAVLFISRKQTIALIAGLLVSAFCLATVPVYTSWYKIYESKGLNDSGAEEYHKLLLSNQSYAFFDQRFDYSEFNLRTYYEGRDLNIWEKSSLNPVLKNAILVYIYTNPLLIYDLTELQLMTDVVYVSTELDITPYMMCRYGLVAINVAANIFWISLMSCVVIFATRKKEVPA